MAMKSFNSLFDKFKNLSVRYIDYDLIKNQLDEHYGIEMDISALIPFILKKYEKVLVFFNKYFVQRFNCQSLG